MKVEVGASGLALGFIEMVAQPVRGYVRSVRAGNQEISRLLAVAHRAYELG